MDPEANFLFRLHDASLYNNRYYLYFGPVPTLALFIPYRLLTHADLPPAAALLLLESAGFLLSVLALFQLFAAWRLEPPLWLQLCAISSLGISQLSPYLLQLADVYEIAVASGYAFTMAARLRLVRAPRGYRPVRDMLLGGLLLGLACGCRPDFLVVMCAIAALNGFAWFKRRLPMRAFVAYVAPAFLCGVALAAYNYARFGNPLEFGLKYQLSGGAAVISGPHASLRNAAAGLYFFNLIAS
jgi:hypothetical protein